MEERTILALLLIALVLLSWQFYIAKYYPPGELVSAPQVESGADRQESVAQASVTQTQAVETAMPEKELEIETEKYIVTLTNKGGCIKSIVLKEYPDPRTNEIFKLVDIEDPAEGIFSIDGLGGYDLAGICYNTNEKGNEVIFSTQLSNGLEITKKYVFHNSLYNIDLELYIKNTAEQILPISYAIIAASNVPIGAGLDRTYTHFVSDISGKPWRGRGLKKGTNKLIKGSVKYAGLQSRYFSIFAKPSAATDGMWIQQTEDNNMLSKIEIGEFNVPPRSNICHTYLLYAGPTKMGLLTSYGLESALSYGSWGGISKALLSGLKLFNRVFKNWGVAIILLSICVNLLLFPLSRKGYVAMKESQEKMQELQPQLEKLRSQHKNNPQKLNKETMELYRKYNMNPMGGCLPLLLQMPIFIALYQALMRSLDLRGASFLWVRDLSMPDAVSLPFTLPILGNSVNTLPILMAGAMVLQQQMSTRKNVAMSEQARQQQQMMGIMMPVLFLFLLYNFPSGLTLYWLTNTILTIFEQRAIMHG